MKKLLIFALALITLPFVDVFGQISSQYSQYMFHGLYINPAYAGYKENLNFHSYFRSQWTNTDGGPRTFAFAADMLTGNEKAGLGFNIINDRIGGERRTSTYVNYAHRLRLNEEGTKRLVIGMGAGFVVGSYDNNGIITEQPEPLALESTFLPDVRVGVFYYTPAFFAGLGVDNLISSAIHKDDITSIKPLRHYYVHTGGLIPMSEGFMFKPSALVKTAGNPDNQNWVVDVNAAVLIAEQFTVGASYRTGFFTGSQVPDGVSSRNSVIGLVEFVAKNQIRVGYSFDYGLNKTLNDLGGTHEISVGYTLLKTKVRERSPRYF